MSTDKKRSGHLIKEIIPHSIAEELEIMPGDRVLAINGQKIEDIFDYQFLTEDTYVEVLIENEQGEQWIAEVDKEEDEDLGIIFDNGLMDEYRSCHNKCIFCFIDQMPQGMRDTLYFKDDDSRLSFLQGNYVTLTNMSEHDIDRIIQYHLSPINISFQTMNPHLRCKMLNNRFAGEALKKVDRLYEAGISMNGQIVLCKGVNDGEELSFSIRELMKYLPHLQSVSVVPVGLTKFREGLYPLEPFTEDDAVKVLDLICDFQEQIYKEHGIHFVHASDEWYIMAGRELPREESYDGYLQLENGVGMLRLMLSEFEEGLQRLQTEKQRISERLTTHPRRISLVTGMLAAPYIEKMAQRLMEELSCLTIKVYAIRNDFFGEMITVSGLLTGQDIIAQLTGQDLGEILLLPQNVLRSGEDVFLDDVTVSQLEKALQVRTDIVKSSGYDFINAIIGEQII